jgi:glycosyltransferase involved in cell wall biosynthesis
VAATSVVHRVLGTWERLVDAYIVLTEFSRRKFEEFGLPAEKLHVKPNFLFPEPSGGDGGGDHALFVGRLSQEKGIETLLNALEHLRGRIPTVIVGDGPLASRVEQATKAVPRLQWLGQRSLGEIYDLMGRARFLVVPSHSYETFGRVIVEAFACGTPVIVSRVGAPAELVDDGRTGLLFRSGDSDDLARAMTWADAHRSELTEMRKAARAEFESKYTAERNYGVLMDIYGRAGRAAGLSVGPGTSPLAPANLSGAPHGR